MSHNVYWLVLFGSINQLTKHQEVAQIILTNCCAQAFVIINLITMIPIVEKDKISKPEMEQVQQEKQEYHLIGSFLRTAGLKLYGYNHLENKIFEVEIKYGDTINLVPMDGVLVPVDYTAQECMVDSRFEYFECLNMKNAERRVKRYKAGMIDILSNLRIPSKDGIRFY